MNSWSREKSDKERDGKHRERYLCAVCSLDSPARLHRHSAKVWVRAFAWKVWFSDVVVFVWKCYSIGSNVFSVWKRCETQSWAAVICRHVSNSKKCLFLRFSNRMSCVWMCCWSRCWSYLGVRGGRQTLSLQSPNCLQVGVISHEFMHALGFVHEQARFDRDNYVTIMWPNIWRGNSKGAGRGVALGNDITTIGKLKNINNSKYFYTMF